MGLQVRLRHTLGERLLDLPDRPVEKPLLVGRAREADLKVPSVSVAPQHCALFLHEGQWVLQDMSNGSTFVNGSAMEGPTPLCIGDVIVLGADANPASIEVDPAGAAQGQTGQPARTQEPAAPPARPRPPAMAARARAPRRPMPATRAAPAAPRPLAAPAPVVQSDDPWGTQAPADDPFASWGQPAAAGAAGDAATATPARRRKPKKSSDAGLYVGIAACVVIVGGTAWFVYQKFNPPPPPAPPPAAVYKRVKGPNDNIFTGDSGPYELVTPQNSAKAPAASKTPAEAPPPPPADSTPPPSSEAPPPPPPPADNDPHKGDQAWEEVQGALMLQKFPEVIIKSDDYRRNHPTATAKEIDAVVDEAMDGLWWKRIKLLCDKRDDTIKKIRAKDKDIKEETNPKFRQTLTEEKKPLEQELTLAQTELNTDMGYTNTQAPDPTSKEMMAKLATERDPDKFGAWKLSTVRFIRSTHGKTPWDGE